MRTPSPSSSQRARLLALALVAALGGCRYDDPVAQVEADARVHFACDEVEVRYAGAYEMASTDERDVELYEATSTCGGDEAIYRCEITRGENHTVADCCRFSDDGCAD